MGFNKNQHIGEPEGFDYIGNLSNTGITMKELEWTRTEDATVTDTMTVTAGRVENTGAVEIDPYTVTLFTGTTFSVTYTDDNAAARYYFIGFSNAAVPAPNSFSDIDFGIGWHPSAPLAFTILVGGTGHSTIARSQGDSVKMWIDGGFLKFWVNGSDSGFVPLNVSPSGDYKILIYTFNATGTVISITDFENS